MGDVEIGIVNVPYLAFKFVIDSLGKTNLAIAPYN